MVWPQNGGGGFNRPDYPDCRNGGPHRWSKAHPWIVDASVFYQTCRRCGKLRFTKILIRDGVVHQKEIKDPTGTKTE